MVNEILNLDHLPILDVFFNEDDQEIDDDHEDEAEDDEEDNQDKGIWNMWFWLMINKFEIVLLSRLYSFHLVTSYYFKQHRN